MAEFPSDDIILTLVLQATKLFGFPTTHAQPQTTQIAKCAASFNEPDINFSVAGILCILRVLQFATLISLL